jgi:glycosyltransferase involved in cell wall biosynthesis
MDKFEKPKILMLLNSFEIGGAEKLLVYFIKSLQHNFKNIQIAVLENKGQLKNEFERLNIPIYNLHYKGKGNDFSLILKLIAILKKENIDILHTHNIGPHFYGSLASLIANTSFKVHTQHGIPVNFNLKSKMKHRFLDKKSDVLIAVSDDVNQYLQNKWRPKSRLLTIHNGIAKIKITKAKNDILEELNIPNNSKIIGHVGRLSKVKNQELLLIIFAKLKREYNDIYLVIVGDGPLMNSLKKQAESLRIKDKVRMLGPRNDIPDILQIFDIFIMPSLSEGISIALLEAMSLSIPPVVSNVGGNLEVINNNINGFLANLDKTDEFISIIKKILNSNPLSEEIGYQASKTIEHNFSIKTMTEKYIEIYLNYNPKYT